MIAVAPLIKNVLLDSSVTVDSATSVIFTFACFEALTAVSRTVQLEYALPLYSGVPYRTFVTLFQLEPSYTLMLIFWIEPALTQLIVGFVPATQTSVPASGFATVSFPLILKGSVDVSFTKLNRDGCASETLIFTLLDILSPTGE